MSRILVSTNEKWFQDIKKKWSSFYDESTERNEGSVKAVAYKKMSINNENYFTIGNDYIMCVGTLIYKQLFGKAALELLLYDGNNLSIKELRKNMIGSYAVLMKINDTIYIFVDETHTYSLYYYASDEGILICNSYCHMGDVCGLEINSFALLELGVRRCIMSKETPFKQLFKLSAMECISINVKSGAYTINKVELNDYSITFETKTEAINSLFEAIKDVSAIRSQHIKRTHHFLTGGIDSRLELAIHLYNGDEVSVGYWIGRDLLTNGTKEDADIVGKIANDFGIDFTLYDVEEDTVDSILNINRDDYNQFGEHASTYAGNKKLFSIFKNLEHIDGIGFGYLGETIRPLSQLDTVCSKEFSLQAFVEEVYCRTELEKEIINLNGFYDYLKYEMQELLKYTNESDFNKDSAFKLFSFSRFEADCSMSNFTNLFTYGFPIFGQKRIADIIMSFKYEWLQGDEIPVRLIELLQPKLLEYPIYSHHRSFTYDKNKSILKKNMKFRILDYLKDSLKNTPFYKVIYLQYLHSIIRPQTSGNEIIAKNCIDLIKKLKVLDACQFEVKNNSSWNGVDIGTIATFSADLKVLNYTMEGK